MCACHSPQFFVDQGDELAEGGVVALAPPDKQRGHRLTRFFGHSGGLVYGKPIWRAGHEKPSLSVARSPAYFDGATVTLSFICVVIDCFWPFSVMSMDIEDVDSSELVGVMASSRR